MPAVRTRRHLFGRAVEASRRGHDALPPAVHVEVRVVDGRVDERGLGAMASSTSIKSNGIRPGDLP